MSKYIITLDASEYTTEESARLAIETAGGTDINKFSFGMFFEVSGDLEQLQSIPNILAIEEVKPEHQVKLSSFTRDHLDYTVDPRGEKTFNPTYTGAGSHVFLLDTGINADHDEFSQSMINNLYSRFTDPGGAQVFADSTGHGTAMASLIVGGNVGVSPDAVLHNVKLFDTASGEATIGDIMFAFDAVYQYCDANLSGKLPILCLPWTTDYSETINSAVSSLLSENFVVVCAAGNDGVDVSTKSPASVNTAITVGAYNRNLEVSNLVNTPWGDGSPAEGFVNYGAALDIFALGVDVSVANYAVNTAYNLASGTSVATAIAAGAVATYAQGYPDMTSEEMREGFLATGHRQGSNLIFDTQDPNVDYNMIYPAIVSVLNLNEDLLSSTMSGRLVNVKAGDVAQVNLQLNADATDVQVLNFSPLPPWATLDTATGELVIDTTSINNVTVPGVYLFAIKGTVDGDILVSEFSIGLYQSNEEELSPESENVRAFYYDADNDAYDEVVSYSLSKGGVAFQ